MESSENAYWNDRLENAGAIRRANEPVVAKVATLEKGESLETIADLDRDGNPLFSKAETRTDIS